MTIMTEKRQKLLLIVIGLIVAVLLLEVLLRLTGFIYKAYRMHNEKIVIKEDKGMVKILCLGDSFTFGLGAEQGYSYPDQLEKLLNKNYRDKKFIVYNAGIPGQNSSQVLKRLVLNIRLYRPEMIILLIGSNDRTVLEDSNYYLFKKDKLGKIMGFFLKLDISLSNLRSYKLIRTAVLNLRNKFYPEASLAETGKQKKPRAAEKKPVKIAKEEPNNAKKEPYLQSAQSLYDERKFGDAEKVMKDMPGGYDPKSRRESLLLGNIYCEEGKYGLALIVLEGYMKDNPAKDASTLFTLGRVYYMRGRGAARYKGLVIGKEDFGQATRILKEALLYADPEDLYLKGEIYSYLARLYLDQKENELAKEMMENALRCRPDDNFFQQFIRVISESSLSQEENEIFKKQLYYNLGCIINLCRLYNAKIILLNYPCEYTGGIRKEIANKYKVPFIDIGSRFAELLSKCKYKDLFSKDEHPNANGYRVIAENVFEALRDEIGVLR